jgi:hypothetical protein
VNLRLFYLLIPSELKMWVRSEVDHIKTVFEDVYQSELRIVYEQAAMQFEQEALKLRNNLLACISLLILVAENMTRIEDAITKTGFDHAHGSAGQQQLQLTDLQYDVIADIKANFFAIICCVLFDEGRLDMCVGACVLSVANCALQHVHVSTLSQGGGGLQQKPREARTWIPVLRASTAN